MGSVEGGPLRTARLIARQVITNLHANDEVALFDVGDEPELILPATCDKESALRTLDRHILWRRFPGTFGGRGIRLHDTVYEGAEYLKTTPEGKQRVIAVVTDNETTPPNSRSATEALHEALEADAVVVGLIAEGYVEELITNWNKLVHGAVRAYAEETGGEVMWIKGGKELLKISSLLDRLRTRYVLGYYPTNPQQDGKTRKIKLDLSPSAKEKYGKIKLIYRRRYSPAGNVANQSQ